MSMRDPAAVFFGGYDYLRIEPAHPVPRWALALGVATTVLLLFVAADVSAYESLPTIDHVTSVNWFVKTILVHTSPGFAVPAGHRTTLVITCQLFCLAYSTANTSAPFSVAHLSVVNGNVEQWINVTIQAPDFAYRGTLNVTLGF